MQDVTRKRILEAQVSVRKGTERFIALKPDTDVSWDSRASTCPSKSALLKQRETFRERVISIHKEHEGKVKVVLKTYCSVIQLTLWNACRKLLTLILDTSERGHFRMISDSGGSFCGLEHHLTTFKLSTRNTFISSNIFINNQVYLSKS